ncbi:MAG: hypothetical protein JRH20_24570, partial [Deltaproteobacteria bacterium]|nr:hypothetical protein [Deltaproteobacteria bacterium]
MTLPKRALSSSTCLCMVMLLCCNTEENRQPDSSRVDAGVQDVGVERSLVDLPSELSRSDRSPGDLAPDISTEPGLFELQTPERHLKLWWLGGGVVRFHYLPVGSPAQAERGWTMAVDAWPTEPLLARDDGQRWVIKTAAFSIFVHKSDASVRIEGPQRQVLFGEKSQGSSAYSRKVIVELPADAHIYGLGEKLGPLDKRGMALRMWNTDVLEDGSFNTDEDPLYQSIPYFIMHRSGKPAVGVYLASTFETRFDLGKARADELSFETMGGDLDYIFIYGPSIKEVVRGFTGLVGRMQLPPLWALGYHQCKWSYSPESEVRAITQELRARKIPCDGIWLDIDYMDGFRSFTWSPTA